MDTQTPTQPTDPTPGDPMFTRNLLAALQDPLVKKELKNSLISDLTHSADIAAEMQAADSAALGAAHLITAADLEPGGPFAVWLQAVNTAYKGDLGALTDSPQIKAILAKLGIAPPPGAGQ